MRISLCLYMSIGVCLVGFTGFASTFYVSATDATCGGMLPCYSSIQAAVDTATSGDSVLVAAGTYAGVSEVTIEGLSYHQVVAISKALSLLGGFTETDWVNSSPDTNVTIIDAGSSGRGVTVLTSSSGTNDVVIAGFTIRNGDYSGLGNAPSDCNKCPRTGGDCAGGLFAEYARITLRDCVLSSNFAGSTLYSDGGGVALWRIGDGSLIERVTFSSNTATGSGGEGGGIKVMGGGNITIRNCYFANNTSSSNGGGADFFQPSGKISIEQTIFHANTSNSGMGGGLNMKFVKDGDAAEFKRLKFDGNTASLPGSAFSLLKQGQESSSITVTNLMVLGNLNSAAISIEDSFGDLEVVGKHLTVAGHDTLNAFEFTNSDQDTMSVTLTDTLVSQAATAFSASEEGTGSLTLTHTNCLVFGVNTLHDTVAGSPVFNDSGTVSDDPNLSVDGHLQEASGAIDAGVDSGVSEDYDGDSRPQESGYDIGADEFVGDGLIFSDGFESGNMTEWDSSQG